jgi:hypothetical protein
MIEAALGKNDRQLAEEHGLHRNSILNIRKDSETRQFFADFQGRYLKQFDEMFAKAMNSLDADLDSTDQRVRADARAELYRVISFGEQHGGGAGASVDVSIAARAGVDIEQACAVVITAKAERSENGGSDA